MTIWPNPTINARFGWRDRSSYLFDFQARVRANTAKALIIDLTSVPYVDSAGIGALVGAYATHQKQGKSLYLVGVNERVLNALKVTLIWRSQPSGSWT